MLNLKEDVWYRVYHKPEGFEHFFHTEPRQEHEARERLKFIKKQSNNSEAYLIKETTKREIIE